VHEPKLAVLYVSGHADKLVGDMQSHVGDAPIIAKPFTPIELARAVRRSLDDRGVPRKQNGGPKPDMKTNHHSH
jgi:hypothetical protein